jgi:hypothetical protein
MVCFPVFKMMMMIIMVFLPDHVCFKITVHTKITN